MGVHDAYILENDAWKAVVDSKAPVIYEYVHQKTNARILGAQRIKEPIFTVFKGADVLPPKGMKALYLATEHDKGITYSADVFHGQELAIQTDITFFLCDNQVSIEINHIKEFSDYHLMTIQLPELITVSADDRMGKLVIPSDCGRLLDVQACSCGKFSYQIDWITPALTGAAYHDGMIGVLETDAIENQIDCEIYRLKEEKRGSLSMLFIHRLSTLQMVEFGYQIPALEPKYHLKVQDACKITITLAQPSEPTHGWMTAAKLLEKKAAGSVNPFYADKIISKIALELPDREELISFQEALWYAKTLSRVTGHAQVIYLVGWQYEGHDTGYPSVDVVNEKLGGYDGLKQLMEEARKENVIISFHDNYDDAYPSSPSWDEQDIAVDPQGNWMRSGNFGTGQAYLISNLIYAKHHGEERVAKTLKMYPIADTYHIDVLAGGYKGGRKYDFHPDRPAGAKANLAGKCMIIDAFNKRGIDVTTEDFSQLFIGKVSHFWHMNFLDKVFFRNEEKIPFVPAIYHSKASYGRWCASKEDVMYALLHGATYSCDINAAAFWEQIGYDCLVALPALKLYGKSMTEYVKTEAIEKVLYEDGSFVEVDWGCLAYRVVVDGECIAKNFSTFVEYQEGRFIAFSLEKATLNYSVPKKYIQRKCITSIVQRDGSLREVESRVCGETFVLNADQGAIYQIQFEA